ncbi:LIM domain-containing protein [Salmonella sp. s51933]
MSETCPCCDNPVFSAEKACISGKNGEVWHKHCLKCCECSKMLDKRTAA